jgi:hypothetical protein
LEGLANIFKNMEKKSFIKTGVVLSIVFAASLFGFSSAFGYGGSSGVSYSPACASVTYGEWSTCVDGIQYRDVVSKSSSYCTLTAGQQLERSKSCSVKESTTPTASTTKEVLSAKVYPDGSLLRGPDGKVYVVTDGALKHIASLSDLAKYANKKIVSVDAEVIASFKKTEVLGDKTYSNGSLLRGPDFRIYAIASGKKHHVLNLTELSLYFGRITYNVSNEVLGEYPEM